MNLSGSAIMSLSETLLMILGTKQVQQTPELQKSSLAEFVKWLSYTEHQLETICYCANTKISSDWSDIISHHKVSDSASPLDHLKQLSMHLVIADSWNNRIAMHLGCWVPVENTISIFSFHFAHRANTNKTDQDEPLIIVLVYFLAILDGSWTLLHMYTRLYSNHFPTKL